jgi:hypothetical protein
MGSNGNVREEYLVRGAYLACEYGTHHRRLNLPWSHGVYIKDKEHCLMNAADCAPGEGQGYNIPPFGICQAPGFPRDGKKPILLKTETVNPLTGETYRDANGRSIKFEDNVKGCRCEAIFEKNMWQNTHSKTLVCLKGETPYPALTTGSFLYCKYGGHVYPINSGQPMLDPPKADVELLALIQETEIQPELIPLAQGAAGATPARIPGATISVDDKTINSVYSKSGKVYVDFFEAIRAYDMHTSLKSSYKTDGIVTGSIQTSYKYRKVEYTLDLAKGTVSYTLYALGRNSITKKELWVAYKNISNVNASMFFINSAKQSERKYLVEFDYLHQLMCNLGNAEDKTITENFERPGAVNYRNLAKEYGSHEYKTKEELLKAKPVEVIARTIYGEQTANRNQGQDAVAWLIANRTLAQRMGEFTATGSPTNLLTVATSKGMFTALEKEDGNLQSYTKKTDADEGWVNAVTLAYKLTDVFDNNFIAGVSLETSEKAAIRQLLESKIGESPIGNKCWYVARYQWDKVHTKSSDGKDYYGSPQNPNNQVYSDYEDFGGNVFFNYTYLK